MRSGAGAPGKGRGPAGGARRSTGRSSASTASPGSKSPRPRNVRAVGASRLPLAGRSVLITRPAGQGDDLRERLEALGARVIHVPLIRIEPIRQPGGSSGSRPMPAFDWIVLTSASGASALLDHPAWAPRAPAGLARDPAGPAASPKVCAVGPATAARLAAGGVPVDLVPPEYHAEGVLRALAAEGVRPGTRVLVVRGDRARRLLPNGLRRLGAEVTEATLYRTILEPLDRPGGPAVTALIRDGTIDAVLLASGSAVASFTKAIAGGRVKAAARRLTVACIGPVTASAARRAGLAVRVTAPEATNAALAAALAEALTERRGP